MSQILHRNMPFYDDEIFMEHVPGEAGKGMTKMDKKWLRTDDLVP